MLRLKYSTDNYIELYNDDILVFRTPRTFPSDLIWYNDAFDEWNYQVYCPNIFFYFDHNKLNCRFRVYGMTLNSISDVISMLNAGASNRFVFAGDDYNISVSIKPEFIDVDLPSVFFQGCGGDVLTSSFFFNQSDFETNLYPELINNDETKSMLETWVNDGDISGWTSDDKQIMQMIEDYNHNVLQLRATKKVEAFVSGSISSGQQSDLTGVENKLQNINSSLISIKDNLQYTDTDDVTKGLAQIELEKDNSVMVQNNMVESAPFNPHLQKNDLFEG